jgi:hypothetical protein
VQQKKTKSGIKVCSLLAVIVAIAGLPLILFHAGCSPGIIAVATTPTSAEQESTAEYDLSKDKNQKILVFVDQPAYLRDYPNLRFYLTDVINNMLEEKVNIKKTLLIEYRTLADFRVNTPDFAMLSPAQVGEKLGANLVLAVTITDCKVREISEAGYFSGTLDAHAALFSVSSGE